MTFQYPIKQLVLSHSGLSTLDSCDRKFELSKMFGDAVERNEQFTAGVGQALHAGCQTWLAVGDEEQAVLAYLKKYPYETEFEKYDNTGRSVEAGYSTLMAMLGAVSDRYELVHIKTQLPGNPVLPAVEVPFAFEIIGAPLPIPVYFVGFIDTIWRDKIENRIEVNDIKTHRLSADDLSPRYQFDQQTVPYGIVLEHALGHKVDDFWVSYMSTYIDLLNPKISIYPFPKTQEDTHDWYRGLCEDIKKISISYRDKWFRRTSNGSICFSFNKPCYYANECSVRNPEIMSRLLNTQLRDGLFHSGERPWIVAKLPYREF